MVSAKGFAKWAAEVVKEYNLFEDNLTELDKALEKIESFCEPQEDVMYGVPKDMQGGCPYRKKRICPQCRAEKMENEDTGACKACGYLYSRLNKEYKVTVELNGRRINPLEIPETEWRNLRTRKQESYQELTKDIKESANRDVQKRSEKAIEEVARKLRTKKC